MNVWRRGVNLLGGVAALEVALVGVAGPVAAQVRAIGGLGDPAADPVAGLLAVLAVAAELLAAYLLLVVVVRLAAWLPGTPGRVAARCAHLVALPVLRRALDGLLGGVLLAQVVLAPAVARAEPSSSPPGLPPAAAASALAGGAAAAAGTGGHVRGDRGGRGWASQAAPAQSAPAGGVPTTSSTVASPPWVPLPTWLGGGQPSTTGSARQGVATTAPRQPSASSAGRGPDGALARGGRGAAGTEVSRSYVVRPGDTLWDVAAAHLPRGGRSAARVDRYWRRIYGANRGVLGDDPHLIHPGARLTLPPAGPPRPGGG